MLVVVDASSLDAPAVDGVTSLAPWLPGGVIRRWSQDEDPGSLHAALSAAGGAEPASVSDRRPPGPRVFVVTSSTCGDTHGTLESFVRSVAADGDITPLRIPPDSTSARARADFAKLLAQQERADHDRRRERLIVVGALMRLDRQHDLCQRGLLHMCPWDGVMYVPLDTALPLEEQADVDAILQKATDSLVPSVAGGYEFSHEIRAVQHTATERHIPVIDPLASVSGVVDRIKLRELLGDVSSQTGGAVAMSDCVVIRSQEDWAAREGAVAALMQCGDALIVKPAVACGVPASHKMALVTSTEALRHLQIDYPALVEVYHNHGGVQFKCYVIGRHVHCAVKASMPDVHGSFPDSTGRPVLRLDGEEVNCTSAHVLEFDSLKSLPLSRADVSTEAPPSPEVLQACADVIQRRLGLTLFGFDLIRPARDGEALVMIDVNAFPSYKGVDSAPHELRTVLKAKVV